MVVRTFKYHDYDGNEREEEARFNLTKTEIMELSMSVNGGLDQMIRRIVSAQDGATIMSTFREILLKAYGEKSLDGRRFVKSKELSEAFAQTPMYDELFQDLVYNADKAAEFFRALGPKIEDETTPPTTVNPSRGAITNFTPGPLPFEERPVTPPVLPPAPPVPPVENHVFNQGYTQPVDGYGQTQMQP